MSRVRRLLEIAEHVVFVYCAFRLFRHVRRVGLKAVLTKTVISVVKAAPGGAALMDREQQKTIAEIKAFANESMGEFDEFGDIKELPHSGWSEEKLFPSMIKLRGIEKDYQQGKAFGGIYCDDKKLKAAINRAYCEFSDSNGLFPNVFPALKKFEMEVVRMTIRLLHGSDKAQGMLTTGGSESILLALKAYKERGVAEGISDPEAIIPISSHPAFAKGCNYFGIKLIPARTLADGRVDVEHVKALLTRNTVVIVGNAPSFSSGAVDPIQKLSDVALKHKVGLHVDLCLGGFLLPFLEKSGHLKPGTMFDFRAPGVSSVSADLHKYGFGPKGTSVLLFSTAELRQHCFFSYTEWSGGQYASPSMTGSRSGGIIASAWATLMLLGEDGYTRIAGECWQAFVGFRDGINAIPGFRVIGDPDAACIAFKCTDGPENKCYQVASAMKKHFGWQMNFLQKPLALGLQIGSRRGADPVKFCQDLKESLAMVEKSPQDYSGGLTQIYGMAANLGDREVVGDLLKSYLSEQYRCQ